MHIVADKGIPAVAEAFSSLGEVKLVDGRGLVSADIEDAEILLVRSITRVNAELLQGTPVRWVGSATSGIDHIDLNYLQQNNIDFVNAAGANARAVAEYVICIIAELAQRFSCDVSGKVLGVIGYGHVGQSLARLAPALGLQVLINDPPLEAAGKQQALHFSSLDDVLQQSDIVSLHVPLVKEGSWPTLKMVNQGFLAELKTDSWLINTSRGAVIDSGALLQRIRSSGVVAALDVWEGEPNISLELLQEATLATPHVAGYSEDAKLNATHMLYQAVCRAFSVEEKWAPGLPECAIRNSSKHEITFDDVIKQAYDLMGDDSNLRRISELPEEERGLWFDRLRSQYAFRREFSAWVCPSLVKTSATKALRELGFRFNKV